jgi:HSP20 family protein
MQTMTIRGHSERSYASGTPPAGMLEGTRQAGMITNGGKKETKKETEKKDETGDRSWCSERSVGDFMRTFNFPTSVDQEKCKATMKNGILSIKVPKMEKAKGHKVAIEN